MRLLICLLLLIVISQSECNIPPDFKKCNRNEAIFKTCLLDAVQDGIKRLDQPHRELNLPSLNPLILEELSIKSEGSVVAVNQNFKNCQLFGFVNTIFDKFEINFEKKSIDVLTLTPEITAKCEYNLDGKILLLALKGEGDSTVIFKNFKTSCHMTYIETTKNNKTYIKIVNNELEGEPELVHLNFENIFKDNKELNDNINRSLNDNWKEIYQEIKGNYDALIEKVYTQLFNAVFSKISLEEAFD